MPSSERAAEAGEGLRKSEKRVAELEAMLAEAVKKDVGLRVGAEAAAAEAENALETVSKKAVGEGGGGNHRLLLIFGFPTRLRVSGGSKGQWRHASNSDSWHIVTYPPVFFLVHGIISTCQRAVTHPKKEHPGTACSSPRECLSQRDQLEAGPS